MTMNKSYRSSFAKFRCGVAPIRLETGRYENLPVNARVCPLCTDAIIEDEIHVVLNCPAYTDLRYTLFQTVQSTVPDFNMLPDVTKFSTLFSNPNIVLTCAKTCFNILQRRRWLIYN